MVPFFVDLLDRFHQLHTEIEQALQPLPRKPWTGSPVPI
jgi:hypothetical protein